MKKNFLSKSALFVFILLFNFNAHEVLAQDNHLPYSAGNKSNNSINDVLIRNLEITAGYLPKQGNEAVKASISVNNILMKRIGFYTSFEYAMDGNKISNTFGGTVSLLKFMYAWGGIDVFTKNGLIQSGFEGSRKEVGIGITPYKFVVLRIGYSNSVGTSLAAGFRIPL